MALTPGTRLGSYDVLSPLGAGGMGEVYRARDTRLNRDVAIKALPAEFAQDPERLARFEREARLLASLSHPNIAGIYGVEEAAGTRYLVLEFVDGETLAARLARGPLSLDDALDVARQIASGVEAAHESGVIHRDLKPGNVMLTPDGGVKVLDFGLARSGGGDAATSDPNLTSSPTRTYAATQAGIVLGTAAYMSPEQARGKRVDRRTDIWSFGCVLFECLAGGALFDGETVSDLIARILQTEPEWNRLPAGTPPRVHALLKRCLRRDPKERLRDIGDARIELAEVIAEGPEALAPARTRQRGTGVWPWVAGVAALAAVALAIGLATKRPEQLPLLRLNLLEPGLTTGSISFGNYAVSPDGSAIVFVARRERVDEPPRLFVRELGQPTARMIEGTEGASMPFWSPDSRHLAFFAEETLRRVPAAGGGVQNLCDAGGPRGGAWGDGEIVFASSAVSPLYRVPESGGTAVAVTAFDTTRSEDSHRFPVFLPDGRHFLFIAQGSGEERGFRIRIGSLDGSAVNVLQIEGDNATFAAPDWVLFVRDQSAMAQRINMKTFEPVGAAVLLDPDCSVSGRIASSPLGSASLNGILVLLSDIDRPTRLEWAYPDGRVEPIGDLAEFLLGAELSPDGRRVAFMRNESPGNTTWVYDIDEKRLDQVMKRDRGMRTPVWDPSGTKLAGLFVNEGRNEPRVLDLLSGVDSLIAPGAKQWGIVTDWSAATNTVLFCHLVSGRGMDIAYIPMTGTRTMQDYLASPGNEASAVISPDGRWIAYWSDATGTWDLVVDTFPVPSGARRLATGLSPAASASVWTCSVWWSHDGRSLVYTRVGDNDFKAVEVRTEPTLSLGPPRLLMSVEGEVYSTDWDPEARRALLARPIGESPSPFIVIQNWTRQLDTTE